MGGGAETRALCERKTGARRWGSQTPPLAHKNLNPGKDSVHAKGKKKSALCAEHFFVEVPGRRGSQTPPLSHKALAGDPPPG